MTRLSLTLAALAFFALPMQAALADTVEDLVEVLEKQGYREISVERTLLGRTRILAEGEDGTREMIVNARTGEILRDVWIDKKGRTRPAELASSGSDDDDDDGDDHGGDDGGGDDNSGHGSGGDGGDDD